MRSTLVAGMIVVGLGSVARADDPPLYECHAPAADMKMSVQFKPDASIHDVVTWAIGFTCKNIVLTSEAERAAPRVTIIAPHPLTPKQALALFVDTLETAGLIVTVKPDSILIKPGPTLPQHCPDVSSAGPPASSAVATGGELAPYPGTPSSDELQKLIDRGVKVIDPTHYELMRALVDAVLSDPMTAAKGARIVPAMANGKPSGFKLYAIRPTSLFAKLGFTNGDTLEKINGNALDSADKALEVYSKVHDATKLDVEIIRRGKPLTLTFAIK
jgi:type II secretory pathway component PulC